MSDFLMIGGTRVPIAAPSGADEEYQELGGEVVRSFSGRLLSTVRGRARVWRLQTPPLPESEAQMLAVVLAHGSPLTCSGALIGSDAVSCYARGVRTRPVAPLSRLRRVVEFELHETAPITSPILFRLHAGEALPPGVSFSRASTATYIDRTGTLREVGPDIPRIDWSHVRPALRLEGSRTNAIRNPRGEGAVVGVVGSDGALPTFWGLVNTAGLTWEVVATGVEDGLPYVDVRLHGTPSQTFAQMRFEDTTAIAAAPGETWTGTFYSRLVAGSMSGIGEARVRIQERDAGGVVLNQSQSTFDPDSAPRLSSARRTYTHTVSDPNAAAIVLMFGLGGLTVGNAIDVTFRIGAPQLEQAPVPSSLILPPPGAPAPAARTVETVTVPWPHAPQPMTLYVRMVEIGGVMTPNFDRVVEIGSGANRIRIQVESNQDRYNLRYDSGGQTEFRTASAQPAPGQVVELMVPLSEAGARLVQAIDGGSPAQTSLAALPLPSAWGTPTLTIGGGGQFDLLDLLILRGASWTMDAVRRLVR